MTKDKAIKVSFIQLRNFKKKLTAFFIKKYYNACEVFELKISYI